MPWRGRGRGRGRGVDGYSRVCACVRVFILSPLVALSRALCVEHFKATLLYCTELLLDYNPPFPPPFPLIPHTRTLLHPPLPGNAVAVGGALNDYPCPGAAMNIWLKLTSVKKALNIQADNRFNSADNGIGMNYTLSEKNLLPFYQHVMQKTDLKVLVYNGDTDPGINSMVTQDKYGDATNFRIQRERERENDEWMDGWMDGWMDTQHTSTYLDCCVFGKAAVF